jgi:hypothetical protein
MGTKLNIAPVGMSTDANGVGDTKKRGSQIEEAWDELKKA